MGATIRLHALRAGEPITHDHGVGLVSQLRHAGTTDLRSDEARYPGVDDHRAACGRFWIRGRVTYHAVGREDVCLRDGVFGALRGCETAGPARADVRPVRDNGV